MHALHDFQIIENSSFLIIIESCAAYIGYVINNIYSDYRFERITYKILYQCNSYTR